MDAFTMAAQMFGDLELSPFQLAQLRAINRKYYQELYTLLHELDGEAEPSGPRVESRTTRTERELTEEEIGRLNASLESDVRAVLTGEQRGLLDQR